MSREQANTIPSQKCVVRKVYNKIYVIPKSLVINPFSLNATRNFHSSAEVSNLYCVEFTLNGKGNIA